jgi:hypothetical protein
MRQAFKTGLMILLLIGSAMPAGAQSLFESSQTGSKEQLVSSNLSLGGFFRSVAYLSTDPVSDKYYLQGAYAQVGLLLDASAGSLARAGADLRLKYGTEFRDQVIKPDLREAWVDLQAGPAGFRFGKLISPRGKGTVFNPTDKLTPLDPTVRSPEEDDMLLGSWALQGRIMLGSYMKLEATWKPVYRPSVLLIDPVPLPSYVKFLDPAYPGVNLDEGSFGLSYDLHTGLLDLSLCGYDGYDSWPGIAYDSFVLDPSTMEPDALNLREKAYRIRMAGMDFSIPAGPLVIRGEGAWQQPVESRDSAEYLPFPELSYTAELEYSGTHTSIVAGYYGKYILDYVPPAADPSLDAGQDTFREWMQKGITLTGDVVDEMIREQVASFNRLYNYQMEEFHHSAFLVGRIFLFHDQLELTLPVIYRITTDEWIIRPGISYMPADGLKISAGYSGLFGPENSLNDLVGPTLNAGYISLRLSF